MQEYGLKIMEKEHGGDDVSSAWLPGLLLAAPRLRHATVPVHDTTVAGMPGWSERRAARIWRLFKGWILTKRRDIGTAA